MSDQDQTAGVDEQQVITEQPAEATKTDQEQARAAEGFSQAAKKRHIMRVKVYSPFRDYYNGQAFSLSAVNATGPFDILPGHHNFISLLSPCELVVRSLDYGEQRILISGGLIHVKADQTIIFLDV